MIEPFLDKDLKVEARREGNNLIIEAKPEIKIWTEFTETILYWNYPSTQSLQDQRKSLLLD